MSIFDRLGIEFSNLRVLFVEDNEFARHVGRTALWQIGFTQILLAKNGREASDLLKANDDINLIVSDWKMPVVSGLDLLKEARQRWPGIPFVMVTASDSEEEVTEARQQGVDAYIIKPFSLDILRQRIVFAFRRRLARGGDLVASLGQGYVDMLDQLEQMTGAVTAEEAETLRVELRDLQHAVEHLLFNPEGRQAHLSAFLACSERIKEVAKGQQLVEPLVEQMTGFIRDLGAPSPVQLEVVKLHVEALDAVMEGRVHRPLDGTRLLQALQRAAEMSNVGPDPYEMP